MNLILASIGVFLVVSSCLLLYCWLRRTSFSFGKVKLTMNGEQGTGNSSRCYLLNTLSVNDVFLSSACGGKGSADSANAR